MVPEEAHVDGGEPEAGEDPLVGGAVLLEADVETGLVDVEGVGVLHGELPHPQQARLGAGLVPELDVHLVPDLGQVPVGEELGGQEGEDLLLGHAQDHVGVLAVLELEEVVAHQVVAVGLLPDLGGMEGGQEHLLAADGVHLLSDDSLDLETGALPEGQHRVRPGSELTDEPGPDQQAVADRLGIGRGFSECGDVGL